MHMTTLGRRPSTLSLSWMWWCNKNCRLVLQKKKKSTQTTKIILYFKETDRESWTVREISSTHHLHWFPSVPSHFHASFSPVPFDVYTVQGAHCRHPKQSVASCGVYSRVPRWKVRKGARQCRWWQWPRKEYMSIYLLLQVSTYIDRGRLWPQTPDTDANPGRCRSPHNVSAKDDNS